jgi:hypothetical protein
MRPLPCTPATCSSPHPLQVLYFEEGAPGPQRGTIAKVEPPGGAGAGSEHPTYYVALKGTPKHPEEAWLCECRGSVRGPVLTGGLCGGPSRTAWLCECWGA